MVVREKVHRASSTAGMEVTGSPVLTNLSIRRLLDSRIIFRLSLKIFGVIHSYKRPVWPSGRVAARVIEDHIEEK
uniref:Uncharacterized protein n=1 Tax=Rhizophagus irregularis (strain DAOM 181602 / DAOM 197198 / MUCL 43194) TaxID=747089 RepID=U9SPQ7_RHIID